MRRILLRVLLEKCQLKNREYEKENSGIGFIIELFVNVTCYCVCVVLLNFLFV